jgi:hypothetical protein
MHHSPKGVKARYLRCSNQSPRGDWARGVGKVPMTCDVITRLHQLRR